MKIFGRQVADRAVVTPLISTPNGLSVFALLAALPPFTFARAQAVPGPLFKRPGSRSYLVLPPPPAADRPRHGDADGDGDRDVVAARANAEGGSFFFATRTPESRPAGSRMPAPANLLGIVMVTRSRWRQGRSGELIGRMTSGNTGPYISHGKGRLAPARRFGGRRLADSRGDRGGRFAPMATLISPCRYATWGTVPPSVAAE